MYQWLQDYRKRPKVVFNTGIRSSFFLSLLLVHEEFNYAHAVFRFGDFPFVITHVEMKANFYQPLR